MCIINKWCMKNRGVLLCIKIFAFVLPGFICKWLHVMYWYCCRSPCFISCTHMFHYTMQEMWAGLLSPSLESIFRQERWYSYWGRCILIINVQIYVVHVCSSKQFWRHWNWYSPEQLLVCTNRAFTQYEWAFNSTNAHLYIFVCS